MNGVGPFDLSSVALAGMKRAERSMSDVVRRVSSGEGDLAADMVELSVAQTVHAVNASVLRTVQDLDRTVLDILA